MTVTCSQQKLSSNEALSTRVFVLPRPCLLVNLTPNNNSKHIYLIIAWCIFWVLFIRLFNALSWRIKLLCACERIQAHLEVNAIDSFLLIVFLGWKVGAMWHPSRSGTQKGGCHRGSLCLGLCFSPHRVLGHSSLAAARALLFTLTFKGRSCQLLQCFPDKKYGRAR